MRHGGMPMQNFSAVNLNAGTSYTVTRAAHEQLVALPDRWSDEAKNLERQVQQWSDAKRRQETTLAEIGPRYAECTLDSYRCECDAQTKVVEALKDYAVNAKQNLQASRNVILIGPKGTGKDHLLVALSRAVFQEVGVATRWRNGVDLMDEFHRHALDPDSRPRRDPNIDADILYVSDPIPPSGALSESKQTQLFQLVDGRYRAMRPTWATMNVFDGAEAEQRMGAQTVDRLRHGALVLFCRWESYRAK